MIVAPPTASGSSAATRLRKTKNESRQEDREREQLGARDVLGDLVADLLLGELAAADVTPGTRSRRLLHAVRARRVTSVAERRDHVGGAAVLRHERAVAAALVARRRSRCPGPGTPSRPARACPAPARSPPARRAARARPCPATRSRRWRARRRGSRAPPRPAGRRSRRPSRAARTPGPPKKPATSTTTSEPHRKRRRRRWIRRARRSSIVSRGGSIASSSIVLRLDPAGGPLLARREHLEVERRDHVEQHPVGEERPQLRRLGARRLGDLAHEVGVALAHPRLDLGVGGGRVALHLEQQRGAVGEQVRVGLAHRRHPLLGRQAARRLGERLGDPPVHHLVAGEEQLALGVEEPEQVRLRDPRLARDLVGRGAVVAAQREVLDRDLDDLAAALGGRSARSGGGHAPEVSDYLLQRQPRPSAWRPPARQRHGRQADPREHRRWCRRAGAPRAPRRG